MTPEERAKQAVDAMAGHWSDYNYDEIVVRFRDAIKTAIEEEREACARIADDYVIKADEFKRKIDLEREKAPSARYETAEEAPIVDAKIAVARLTLQKLAEAIRARSES
jgi:hypothetical protein